MKRCTRCSRIVATVPGFCKACGNYVDQFAPDAEPVQLGERARAAAAGDVATVTEAFTYVPSEHLTRVEDVTIPSSDQAERLPYRFGTFQGIFQMVVGVVIALVGGVSTNSVAVDVLMFIWGALWALVGYGVWKQKKIAVISMLGISAVMNLAIIAQNFASVVGVFFIVPMYYYYIKRLDEMD